MASCLAALQKDLPLLQSQLTAAAATMQVTCVQPRSDKCVVAEAPHYNGRREAVYLKVVAERGARQWACAACLGVAWAGEAPWDF